VTRSIHRGPWRIDLDVRDGVTSPLPGAALARLVGDTLSAAGAPSPASIGVILADDAELAELNATHMGTVGPTDVLSFPLLPPAAYPAHAGGAAADPHGSSTSFVLPPRARVHLGDIVVSVERAIDQAARGVGGQTGDVRWTPTDELRLLVVHGTLHISGWDHAAPIEEAAMRALERRLLAADDR
jgi:probable rRNA maturation factor